MFIVLQKLDNVDYRSPAKKASLLVEAHKTVVGMLRDYFVATKSHGHLLDGLSRLPTLRLKPEGEIADVQPPPIVIEKKVVPTSGSLTPPEMVITEFSDSKGDDEKQTTSQESSECGKVEQDSSQSTTTVSGDILFPFLIYSVVKANPPHLVSHILFTERFRSPNAKGEEKYCIINLMAVVEFLENVDMAALGLGDSDRIMRLVTFCDIFSSF